METAASLTVAPEASDIGLAAPHAPGTRKKQITVMTPTYNE